jgi:hypothetical protein
MLEGLHWLTPFTPPCLPFTCALCNYSREFLSNFFRKHEGKPLLIVYCLTRTNKVYIAFGMGWYIIIKRMGMSGCLEECVRVKGGRWLLPGILLDEAASPGILEQVTSSISDDNPTESSGRRCALPTMASPARLKPTLCAVSTWVHASTTPLRPPPWRLHRLLHHGRHRHQVFVSRLVVLFDLLRRTFV